LSSRVRDFWSGAAGAPLIVLTDFDFTISQVDVGDLIVETLCPPSAETVARCRAGEAGSRVWYLDSMVRADLAEALALADTVDIDPHFAAFAAWCREQSIPLAVVSDGFGFYIERVLGRAGLGALPVFCNELTEPGALAFPHGNPACDRCACCKAQVVRRTAETGARVVYIGDGTSDTYASAFADWVFAKGHLADFLRRSGSPFFPFDSFADVRRRLESGLPAFRAGEAPGRAQLAPSAHCRF
jgi:2,3-diketo-5-methylthio-1-phosphopentane phosphatase